MKFLILLAVVLVSSASSSSVNLAQENKECVVDFLKRHNVMTIESDPHPYTGTAEECDAVVEKINNEFYDEGIKHGYTKCMLDMMREHKTSYVFLKALAYHISDTTPQPIIDGFTRFQSQLSAPAMVYCTYEQYLGNQFDSRVQYVHNFTAEESYCLKHHLIDGENKCYVNTHNLSANPDKIDVSVVDCTEILNKNTHLEMDYTFFELPVNSKHVEDCVIAKVADTCYMDKLMSLKFVAELKLSEEQLQTERTEFIKENADLFKLVSKTLFECLNQF
ncbi:unnamed protein product [Diamesa tonsa]